MKKIGEKLNPIAAAVASLGIDGRLEERVKAEGQYGARCYGPVEAHRAEYVKLRDQLFNLGYQAVVERWVEDRMASREIAGYPEELSREHRALWDAYVAIPCEMKWADSFKNTVVTQGKNDLLDKYLAGSAYTATFYVGLVSLVSFVAIAAGDTAAQINGTNQWKEGGPSNAPNYSQGTRPALTFSSASAGSKTTSAASVFSITSNGTAKGAFAVTANTKEGTTGVLLSAGLFTGGDKAVLNGDTLNVSYTLSV